MAGHGGAGADGTAGNNGGLGGNSSRGVGNRTASRGGYAGEDARGYGGVNASIGVGGMANAGMGVTDQSRARDAMAAAARQAERAKAIADRAASYQAQIAARQALQAQVASMNLPGPMRDQYNTAINDMDPRGLPDGLREAVSAYSGQYGRHNGGLLGGLLGAIGLSFTDDRQSPEEDFAEAYARGLVAYDPASPTQFSMTRRGPVSQLAPEPLRALDVLTPPTVVGTAIDAAAMSAVPSGPPATFGGLLGAASTLGQLAGYGVNPALGFGIGAYNALDRAHTLGAYADSIGMGPVGPGEVSATYGPSGAIPQGLMSHTPEAWSYGNWSNSYNNWG